MNPFSRRSIKSTIWRNIAKKSEPMDLRKDWWLWLFVLGMIGFMLFVR